MEGSLPGLEVPKDISLSLFPFHGMFPSSFTMAFSKFWILIKTFQGGAFKLLLKT
jgi:hypothetical protein